MRYRCGLRHVLLLVLTLHLTLAAETVRAAEPLILYASDGDPPFSYVKDGVPTGIYVDIVREAAAALPDYAVTIVAVPRRRAVMEVLSGTKRALGFFPAYPQDLPKDGRRRVLSAPLLQEDSVVICTDAVFDDSPRRTWPNDYVELRIGRNAGSIVGGPVEGMTTAGIMVEEGPGTRSNLQKLFRGRLDCVLTENLAFLLEMKAMEQDGEFDVTKAPPFSIGASLGRVEAAIAYRPDTEGDPAAEKFIHALDGVLSRMVRNHRVDEIVADRLR